MFKRAGIAAVVFGLAACGAQRPRLPAPQIPSQPAAIAQPIPAPGAYRIDSSKSELRVLVYRAGPLASLGHNHVMVNRAVEGAVVLDQPRLIQVDGIHCEAPLDGNLVFLKNADVPGVIGFVGGVFGKNGINIATFSLGRKNAGAEAVSVIETDNPVPESVLAELLKNPAVNVARQVQFTN